MRWPARVGHSVRVSGPSSSPGSREPCGILGGYPENEAGPATDLTAIVTWTRIGGAAMRWEDHDEDYRPHDHAVSLGGAEDDVRHACGRVEAGRRRHDQDGRGGRGAFVSWIGVAGRRRVRGAGPPAAEAAGDGAGSARHRGDL